MGVGESNRQQSAAANFRPIAKPSTNSARFGGIPRTPYMTSTKFNDQIEEEPNEDENEIEKSGRKYKQEIEQILDTTKSDRIITSSTKVNK